MILLNFSPLLTGCLLTWWDLFHPLQLLESVLHSYKAVVIFFFLNLFFLKAAILN